MSWPRHVVTRRGAARGDAASGPRGLAVDLFNKSLPCRERGRGGRARRGPRLLCRALGRPPPPETVSILSSTGVGTGGGREAPPRRLRSAFAVFTGGGLGRGSRPAGPPAASAGLRGGGRRAGSARSGAARARGRRRPVLPLRASPGGRLCVRLKTVFGDLSRALAGLSSPGPREHGRGPEARPGAPGRAASGRGHRIWL